MSAQPTQASQNTQSSKGWVIVLVLLLLAGAGGGFWMYTQRTANAAPSGQAPLSVMHLEVFVVNLADVDGKGYLRVGIDLGMEKHEHARKAGEFEADQTPAMRDAIISVLSTRQAEELLTTAGKKKLKEDLLQALNFRLPAQNVKEIYFNEFLVQR
jgi:flagellar FliL protein